MKLYSIFDEKAQLFGPVFSLLNDVTARRYVEGLVRNPDSIEHNYKDDFTLYSVGSFHEDNGCIDNDLRLILRLGSIE